MSHVFQLTLTADELKVLGCGLSIVCNLEAQDPTKHSDTIVTAIKAMGTLHNELKTPRQRALAILSAREKLIKLLEVERKEATV